METGFGIALILHFIGWGLLLGGAIAALVSRTGQFFGLMLAGALIALASGFGLMALAEGRYVPSYSGGVMALKIVLTLLLTALAGWAFFRHSSALKNDANYRANYRTGEVSAVGHWIVYLITALAVIAMIFAVIWR